MKGLIESILEVLYGERSLNECGPYIEYRWNEADIHQSSVLYKEFSPSADTTPLPGDVREIYGDANGASLVCGSLTLATLRGPEIFGIYQLAEFHERPEIVYATRVLPGVFFFMHASNVWYYGVGAGNLYVYDAELNEIDCLGPTDSAIVNLIGRWESAGR